MPEPAIATPPAAAPPSAPPSSAPPSSPRVTFGGDSGKPPEPAPQTSQIDKPGEGGGEPELKFDFGFEGDTPEIAAPEAIDGELDYNKPFDEGLKERLKDAPELLKAAQRAYYENREFRKAGFKNAAEAKAHLADLNTVAEGLGRGDGLKGLEAVKAEAQEWQQVTEGFKRGDEGVVNKWFEQLTPEVTDKVMGHALKNYRAKNPQGWARGAAQTFMAELRAPNAQGGSVLLSLNRLYELGKENPDMARELAVVAQAVNQIDEISRQSPAPPPENALSEKETALQQKERGIFVKELSMEVMPELSGAAKKAASVVLGDRKLEGEPLNKFAAKIQEEYNRRCKQDPIFQKNIKAALAAKDVEAFRRLHRAQIKRTMPDAAKAIHKEYAEFGGNPSRRAEAQSRVEGGAGGTAEVGTVRFGGPFVNGGPDPKLIDWGAMRAKAGSRSGAEEMLFNHQFIKKGDSKNIYTW